MAKGPILMLYEAGVPYDLIFQPEDINDEFANAAVARANADWLDSASIDCALVIRGSISLRGRLHGEVGPQKPGAVDGKRGTVSFRRFSHSAGR